MSAKATIRLPRTSDALFETEAGQNAVQMAAYTEEELQQMLNISPALAKTVRQRYSAFFNDNDNPPQCAITAYNGIVFKSMNVGQLTTDDLAFAQRHLWITSFLYGLLRPLDGIKPYRLEGKITLPGNGKSMFSYWRDILTDPFIDSIRNDDGILIDLASAEMRQLFDWKRVENEVRVIKPDFYVMKAGKLTMPSVNAKKCRGAMVAWLIQNRIHDVGRLIGFSHGNSRYHGDSKTNFDNPVFY